LRAAGAIGAEVADADGSVGKDIRFLQQIAAEEGQSREGTCEIAVGDAAAGGRQPVRGAKRGVGHAEGAGFGVHELDKPFDGAGGAGEGAGGVVGGLDHDGVDEVFDGKDFLFLQVNLGAAHLGVTGVRRLRGSRA